MNAERAIAVMNDLMNTLQSLTDSEQKRAFAYMLTCTSKEIASEPTMDRYGKYECDYCGEIFGIVTEYCHNCGKKLSGGTS